MFDPGSELSIDNNWYDPQLAWPVPTYWTLRMTPHGNQTAVEIFHHGFERLGADAARTLEDYESGWTNNHLLALRALYAAKSNS